jgi:3-dehydroquinate dehydratase-2
MIAVHVLNGPNLNLLGRREREIYGALTLGDVEQQLQERAGAGQGRPHLPAVEPRGRARHLGAGGGRATGRDRHQRRRLHPHIGALRDAIIGSAAKAVEIHISNVYKREPFAIAR